MSASRERQMVNMSAAYQDEREMSILGLVPMCPKINHVPSLCCISRVVLVTRQPNRYNIFEVAYDFANQPIFLNLQLPLNLHLSSFTFY